jgi:hypothetical protein
MQDGATAAKSNVCVLWYWEMKSVIKCKDVTVWNMENKHLMDKPSGDGWTSSGDKQCPA